MNVTRLGINGAAATFAEGVVKVGSLELEATVTRLAGGTRVDLAVRNPSGSSERLDVVEVGVDARPDLVLEQGYQSWSVVRRCSPTDVRPERKACPELGRTMHLARPEVAGTVVAGDQVLVTSDGVMGFLGGSRHLSTVEARSDGVTAVALLDGVELAPGGERRLDPVWVGDGDPGERYSMFAELWGASADARATTPAPVGWCTWYQYFSEVTAAVVTANLVPAASHAIEVFQIDDGYQKAIGEWLDVAPGWMPMAELAAAVEQWGMTPGIWTAPFLAAADGPIAARDGWVPRHRSGHPLRAAHNQAWGGWVQALDTTNPEVIDHLTETYASLRESGFSYHKIDFCYAAAMPAERHDPAMTRGQALRAGLDAVRAGIGDDAFLLGCGCPFGPSVGVVDAMRVSADVAPRWAADQGWPGFLEAAPAAVNAVQASALRAPLHRRVFLNDPDCLLLRREALSKAERQVLTETIAGTGGFTIISDDLTAYGDAEWHALDVARVRAVRGDSKLDITDPFAQVVQIDGEAQHLELDWETPWSRLTLR